jgi:benzylsuccinate CoA-transferase BbsF subunit
MGGFKMSGLPLEGYRGVLLGRVWVAPVLSHLLANFGAEVIRVESMSNLGPVRRFRPIHGDKPDPDLAMHFQSWNQCLLSAAADLTKPKALDLVKKLIAKSDIVIENYPPGKMAKYGLDYQSLCEIKPDIIYISLSAVGQNGPKKDLKTYGPSLGALTGLDSMLGYPDGEAAFEYCYTDPIGSVTGIFYVLAALRHRNKTGEGQYIDLAQAESTTCLMGEAIMEYFMTNRERGMKGNQNPHMAPHNLYPCKGEDRWVSIAVKTDNEWKAFCDAMGNPAWTKEKRFSDKQNRIRNQEKLDKFVGEWTKNLTPYEVMNILQTSGVAASPQLEQDEIFNDPHYFHRKIYIEVDHPKLAGIPIYTQPWRFSDTQYRTDRAPMVGEHNDHVYGEILGLSKEEIENLQDKKVLY